MVEYLREGGCGQASFQLHAPDNHIVLGTQVSVLSAVFVSLETKQTCGILCTR